MGHLHAAEHCGAQIYRGRLDRASSIALSRAFVAHRPASAPT